MTNATTIQPPAPLGAAQARPHSGGDGGEVGGTRAGAAEVSLSALRVGESGVIRRAEVSGDDAALLGAMGLAERSRVRVCLSVGGGGACIVAVLGGSGCAAGACGSSRIGLARPLAERIFVTRQGEGVGPGWGS